MEGTPQKVVAPRPFTKTNMAAATWVDTGGGHASVDEGLAAAAE